MFTPRLVILVCLFWLSANGREQYLLSHSHIHPTISKTSYSIFSKKFPSHVSHKHLSLLLLLSGDISLNPGPTTLAFVNSRSMRNKGPLISEMVESKGIDILALAETHIRPLDAPGLIRSITPEGFQFHQKPRDRGLHTCMVISWIL